MKAGTRDPVTEVGVEDLDLAVSEIRKEVNNANRRTRTLIVFLVWFALLFYPVFAVVGGLLAGATYPTDIPGLIFLVVVGGFITSVLDALVAALLTALSYLTAYLFRERVVERFFDLIDGLR